MIQNILLQMLFGAMTGYITNDFALEMLFEKRLGLGGVIPRTKDQFVEKIAELVERDIVTKPVIAEEMAKPEFEKALLGGVKDFFDHHLSDAMPQSTLSQLEGFEELAENLAKFADDKLDLVVNHLGLMLQTEVRLQELMNENQINYATEQIFDELFIHIERGNVLNPLLKDVARDLKANYVDKIVDGFVNFIHDNSDELEQMLGRSINAGLSKMGPMMALLAGGLSFVTASIPKDITTFITDKEKGGDFVIARLDEVIAGEGKLLAEIQEATLDLLKEKRDSILEITRNKIAESVEDIEIPKVIESFGLKELLRSAITPNVIINLLGNIQLGKLYKEKIVGSEATGKLKEYMADGAVNYVKTNATRLVSGRIKEFVQNHLNKYTETEIKEAARDFIGRNLKPITYFGGFLGLLVGAGLGVFVPIDQGFDMGMTAIYVISYAILGWATNFIAVAMLFRPYKKRWYIPYFSPGYIMKNKPIFASSLGRFISEEILSGKIISQWFSDGKAGVQNRLKDKMLEGNASMIRTALESGQDHMANYLVDWEVRWLKANKTTVAGQASDMIDGIKIKPLVEKNQSNISAYILSQLESAKNQVAVAGTIERTLDIVVSKILDAVDEPENRKVIVDQVYDSVDMLKNIPLISPDTIKEVLSNVVENFITVEMPSFWASKSTEVRQGLQTKINRQFVDKAVGWVKDNIQENKRVGQYLLSGETKHAIANQFEKMANSENFIQSEIRITSNAISDIIRHESFLLGTEILDKACEGFAVSAVDALESNVGTILREVNFAEITEEQVLKLDGKEIHKMFDSFMHKYFSSIYKYGLIGGVFGLNVFVSIGLIVLYWTSAILYKAKRRKLTNGKKTI